MNYWKSLENMIFNGSNPVGGQVEAGEKTGYINLTEDRVASKGRVEEATAPSAVNRAA